MSIVHRIMPYFATYSPIMSCHVILLQPSFYGVFEPKLSSFSLCTILTHTLTTSDPRLTSLVVRDEEACPVEAVGVVTRSRRSQLPVRLTEVPVPVKIVKLVIGDIQNGLELEQPVTDESDVVSLCSSLCNSYIPSIQHSNNQINYGYMLDNI